MTSSAAASSCSSSAGPSPPSSADAEGSYGAVRFGVFVQGRWPRVRRLAAFKTAREGCEEALANEARVVQALPEHANVARTLEVFWEREAPGALPRPRTLVYERYDRDGHAALRDAPGEGRLPEVASELLRGLAGALAHVHKHGYVHMDVKPANVLMSSPRRRGDAWRVALSDFGFAGRENPCAYEDNERGELYQYWPAQMRVARTRAVDAFGFSETVRDCLRASARARAHGRPCLTDEAHAALGELADECRGPAPPPMDEVAARLPGALRGASRGRAKRRPPAPQPAPQPRPPRAPRAAWIGGGASRSGPERRGRWIGSRPATAC